MLRTLKWIVIFLVVLVVLAVGVLVTWIPGQIRNGIEVHGSRALGAKVEVAKVELGLFPLALTITDLKATNPLDTMRNIMELGSIQAEINWSTLKSVVVRYLDRQEVVVPLLRFNNISLDQPRSSSGALSTRAAKQEPVEGETNAGVPSFKMPEFEKFIDEESEKAVREFRSFKTRLADKKEYWDERVKALPNEETLKVYQGRIEAFQRDLRGNPLEKAQAVADISSIKDELVRDIQRYSVAREDLKKDLLDLRTQLHDLRQAPLESLTESFNRFGVDSSTAQKLLSDLLGDKLTSWLMSSLQLGDVVMLSSPRSEAAPPKGNEMKLLFESIDITGRLQVGSYAANLTGKVQDATNNPTHFGVVSKVVIEVNDSASANGNLTVSGEFDHRDPKAAKDVIKFHLDKIPLKDLPLSENAQFGIRLNGGVLSASAETIRSGEQIEAHLVLNVEDTTWRLAAAALTEPWGRVLDKSLNEVRVMKLRMDLAGTLADPQLSLRSNLDELLSKGISTYIDQQKEVAMSRAQSRLKSIVDERTREIQGDLVGLDDFTKVLTERQFTFSDYISRL